jgi:hypothetical protein
MVQYKTPGKPEDGYEPIEPQMEPTTRDAAWVKMRYPYVAPGDPIPPWAGPEPPVATAGNTASYALDIVCTESGTISGAPIRPEKAIVITRRLKGSREVEVGGLS